EHPDELRVDLDPGPGVGWDMVQRVALIVRDVLEAHGLRGWPKTSGTRGIHVNVRIERRWSFAQVRRAALALAREVERRAPELSAAQEAAGLGDAPWPPHYKKQADEPPRVAPSRRKAADAREKGVGRRQSTQPLVTVAKAEHKDDALAGLERWKTRHPDAAALLQVDDILIDSMRGRSSTWTRIRINLRHVPESTRPREEPPDPDYDPWRGFRSGGRAPKT